jgi:hypothetical protein
MFSNTLDTVRPADQDQLIAVEAFLMRSALAGTPAVLSPSQALDSAAIQSIVLGNGHNSANHFIRAVRLGIVRVCIPAGCRSLTDYFLSVLRRSEDPNNEFIFSSLRFLYGFEPAFRLQVLRYICTELSEAKLRTRSSVLPAGLSSAEKEAVEQYVSAILQLNDAVELYEQYTYNSALFTDSVRLSLGQYLSRCAPDSPAGALIPRFTAACEADGWPAFRSYYYRLCARYEGEFGPEAAHSVRELVDVCYNEATALSMREQAELNIAPDFAEVASVQAAKPDADHAALAASRMLDGCADKLNWEYLVDICEEVTSICRTSGASWRDALAVYYGRQSRLPFVLSGKYAVITSVTLAVSSIPVVGALTGSLVSQFLWNILCDAGGEALKKPSVQDIVKMSRQSKKNLDLIDSMDIVVCTKDKKGSAA